MDRRGRVWRRSLSKLSTTVKRQLTCFSESEELMETDQHASQPPSKELSTLRNAISLDDRDDEPDHKLERVRLSLVGLATTDQLEQPDAVSLRAKSWDISYNKRVQGMGQQDTGNQLDALCAVPSSESSIDIFEEHDELQSGRYCGVLESLRSKLLTHLPCVTEDMLSRAIINEFASNEEDVYSSPRSILGKREGDNTEADHLFDLIHHWLRSTAPEGPTSEEYFEQSLCKIMHQIRTEELRSADQAYAIVMMLATGLGLHQDLLSNVILIQLPKQVSRASLFDEFSYFGKVKALGVSRKQPLFAFCRFSKDESVARVLSRKNQDAILIRGCVRPKLQSLCKLRNSCNRQRRLSGSRKPQSEELPGLQGSIKATKISRQNQPVVKATGPIISSPTSVAKDVHSSIFR